MRSALRIGLLRWLITAIHGLAGVAAAVPAVNSFAGAKVAGLVAAWGALGATVAGLAAGLQRFGERLEELELLGEE